jgi:signal peptidase
LPVRARSARTRQGVAELLVRGVLGCSILALILVGLLPRTGWYRTEAVLSGSMRPYFSPGDLVVVTPEALDQVRVGQVISYRIPIGDHHVQTHRVTEVVRGGANLVVRTKGDANDSADPWSAKLHGTTAWRVRLVVPQAGWAIARLRSPLVRSLTIFGAPFLLALFGLWRIWRVPGAPELPDAVG